MAQIAKLEVQTEIKSSPAKFYDFIKNHLKNLTVVAPDKVKSFQVLEGVENRAGCVFLVKYVLGSPMAAKVKIESIDDGKNSISYKFLEGEVMQLYKSFKAKFEATSAGVVKWSFEFQKANQGAPNSDLYGNFTIMVCKGLDAYLLTH